MNFLFDILQKQKTYLDKLQKLNDNDLKTAPSKLIQPIIKDYLQELCNVDIYTCLGTFSLEFLN